MGHYDVAIIGGGVAGLTASIYLARAGRSVIVLEKASQIGGRACTVNKSGTALNLGVHALYQDGAAEAILSELDIQLKGADPPASAGAMEIGWGMENCWLMRHWPAPNERLKRSLLTVKREGENCTLETGKLYSELKPLLLSLAYHTLGSFVEAEDIVHDVFLSWEEKPPQHVRDVKAYLCKTVHNRCVDFIRSSSRKREAYVGPWLPEPVDTGEIRKNDPLAGMVWKESLSTAGLLLLQQLSVTERIVFLLREVFHYRFDEIAGVVDKSTVNCRQIFRRAKKSIGQLPERSPEVTVKKITLAERFSEALMAGNIGLLIELLSAETMLYTDGGGKVKAALRPIIGSDKIIRYFIGIAHEIPEGYRCDICEINGMPGIRLIDGELTFVVITFQHMQDRISNLYIVMNPEKLSHFNRMNNG